MNNLITNCTTSHLPFIALPGMAIAITRDAMVTSTDVTHEMAWLADHTLVHQLIHDKDFGIALSFKYGITWHTGCCMAHCMEHSTLHGAQHMAWQAGV